MHAVILVAGQGRRMRPLSALTPKPMLPLLDRPIAAHVADAAVDAGADELVFVVGYEADHVRRYFGDEYDGVPVRYADQGEPTGTADAVRAARTYLDGAFAVLNGDNLYDAASIARLFESGPAVLAYRVPDPTSYGVLSTDGDRVTDVVEKPADPPTNLANAGAYVFPAEALDHLDVERSERGEYELTDVLARVAHTSRVVAVEADRWRDVARPADLLRANAQCLLAVGPHAGVRSDGGEVTVASGTSVTGDVGVRPGTSIETDVRIQGPVLLCPGVHVRDSVQMTGPVVVGAGADIGRGARLEDAVVLPGTSVAPRAEIRRGIVGPDGPLTEGARLVGSPPGEASGGVATLTARTAEGRRGLDYGRPHGDR